MPAAASHAQVVRSPRSPCRLRRYLTDVAALASVTARVAAAGKERG